MSTQTGLNQDQINQMKTLIASREHELSTRVRRPSQKIREMAVPVDPEAKKKANNARAKALLVKGENLLAHERNRHGNKNTNHSAADKNELGESGGVRPNSNGDGDGDSDSDEDEDEEDDEDDEQVPRFTSTPTNLRPKNLSKRIQRFSSIPEPPQPPLDIETVRRALLIVQQYKTVKDSASSASQHADSQSSEDGFYVDDTGLDARKPYHSNGLLDREEEEDEDEDGSGLGGDASPGVDEDLSNELEDPIDLQGAIAGSKKVSKPTTFGCKRSFVARTDQDTTRVTKSQKNGPSKSKTLRASDYTGTVKAILTTSQKHYRCLIFTEDVFPDADQEQDFTTGVWVQQCQRKKLDLDLDDDHFKLMTARGSECRGRVRDLARQAVTTRFGLKAIPADKTRAGRKMCEKVENLLDNSAFVYKDMVNLQKPYLNPVIIDVVYAAWFEKRKRGKPEGLRFPQYFSTTEGITLPTIALVLTVIENILKEYSTGHHKAISFTQADYEESYRLYLGRLQRWSARQSNFVAKWSVQVIRVVRARAGVLEDTVGARQDEVTFDAAADGLDEDDLDAMGVESEDEDESESVEDN
ncbi:hypothetical protein EUX98_g9348 [Antrodiella citrinella]|uniref:DUF6532 domain-containing protein n=1 Tax=Antrodiella citrinella TaxID=2447956 RepID=A0A4S4LUR1_9APHY|nr:hypothetical protein EUX98_g9348 [Antrodiella citrinella]